MHRIFAPGTLYLFERTEKNKVCKAMVTEKEGTNFEEGRSWASKIDSGFCERL